MLDKHLLKQRGLITTGYHLPYNPKLKERARQLRRTMTEPEKTLWYKLLRELEYTVLRQKPLDNYIVDFYCPKAKLVIEVDGDSHEGKVAVEYDYVRDEILQSYDLKVIRVRNEEVMKNFEHVREKILKVIKERTVQK
jgi:very-short-patch-repair endonuclease